MVNYFLQEFLPHPERKLVGADKQFEHTVTPAVDLGRVRASVSASAVFLFAPDSTAGSRDQRAARADPQRGFDER
jgi:hypothetical protein